MDYKIILLKIDNRKESATNIQKILTDYGCGIKVRLGLHNSNGNFCAENGLVVLHVDGEQVELEKMITSLNEQPKVVAKLITM